MTMAIQTGAQAAHWKTTPENVTDEQVRQFRTDGFVKIEGIISKEEAAFYREAALEHPKKFPDENRNAAVFTQRVNCWRIDPVMRQLTLHPNVGAVAEKLSGVAMRLWHDHILTKMPHNNAPTHFHQDQPFWPHENSPWPVSAWIALCDVPAERGCMSFIPGSQLLVDLPTQSTADSSYLFNSAPELVYAPRVTLPLRAGDCTFHHGRCAHMANPNNTDDPRVAHVLIFINEGTTFGKSGRHVVTNPLNLTLGQKLEGDMFPLVSEFDAKLAEMKDRKIDPSERISTGGY